MSQKAKNIKALFGNPKSRFVILTTGVVMIGGAAVAVSGFMKNSQPQQTGQTSVSSVADDARKQNIDLDKVTAEQDAARRDVNQQQSEDALRRGQSFVAVPRPNRTEVESMAFNTGGNRNIRPATQEYVEPEKPLPPIEITIDDVNEAEVKRKVDLHRVEVDARKAEIRKTLDRMNQTWQPGTQATVAGFDVVDWAKVLLDYRNQLQGGNRMQTSTNSLVVESQGTIERVMFARGGDIELGEIEIGGNSDEPSVVTAIIHSGPLRGGRLIGRMPGAVNDWTDKAVINFTGLSHPAFPQTVAVNAVAVDPNTKRAAIASEVNHHTIKKIALQMGSEYLTQYGNLLASNRPTEVVYSSTGQPTVVQGEMKTSDIARTATAKAIGSIGNIPQIRNQINRPTTIKVHAKEPVGVMFVTDFMFEGNEDVMADVRRKLTEYNGDAFSGSQRITQYAPSSGGLANTGFNPDVRVENASRIVTER